MAGLVPLFHGDVKKFGHQFMAHPLTPILDIAGLVTGGAGLLEAFGRAERHVAHVTH